MANFYNEDFKHNLKQFYESVSAESKTLNDYIHDRNLNDLKIKIETIELDKADEDTLGLEHRHHLRDAQEHPHHTGLDEEVRDQPLQQLPEALEQGTTD